MAPPPTNGASIREERRSAAVHVTIGGAERAAVRAAVAEYFRRWPVQGYDTRFTDAHRTAAGFAAVGNRLASRD